MPLSGTLETRDRISVAPRIANFEAEPWDLAGVEILQLKFEIDESRMQSSLPPALHPTIPPTVIFTVATYPDSPAGPFALAQVRVGCRASALPRGFPTRAFCSTQAACDALAANWGYDAGRAEVKLRRYHDRVAGHVILDGREILSGSLIDPEPISGGDIQYVSNMNLARDADGNGVLVQVDPGYVFHRAERGRPEVSFDAEAWRAEGLDPTWPIAASWAQVDTGFPKIRYVLDPNKPAIAGTRRVA